MIIMQFNCTSSYLFRGGHVFESVSDLLGGMFLICLLRAQQCSSKMVCAACGGMNTVSIFFRSPLMRVLSSGRCVGFLSVCRRRATCDEPEDISLDHEANLGVGPFYLQNNWVTSRKSSRVALPIPPRMQRTTWLTGLKLNAVWRLCPHGRGPAQCQQRLQRLRPQQHLRRPLQGLQGQPRQQHRAMGIRGDTQYCTILYPDWELHGHFDIFWPGKVDVFRSVLVSLLLDCDSWQWNTMRVIFSDAMTEGQEHGTYNANVLQPRMQEVWSSDNLDCWLGEKKVVGSSKCGKANWSDLFLFDPWHHGKSHNAFISYP